MKKKFNELARFEMSKFVIVHHVIIFYQYSSKRKGSLIIFFSLNSITKYYISNQKNGKIEVGMIYCFILPYIIDTEMDNELESLFRVLIM